MTRLATPAVSSFTGLVAPKLENGSRVEINDTAFTNLSAEPLYKVMSWLPPNLRASEVVFFPDACPGKSPLPTGTALKTFDPEWRRLAVSDCGCGMQLLETDLSRRDFSTKAWDRLGQELINNKGSLGDLGGGNHFLDAIVSPEGRLFFLVHTGSRNESGLVDDLVGQPGKFEKKFNDVVRWARANRDEVATEIGRVFGRGANVRLVTDLPHNTFEECSDGSVIIRKGVIRVKSGQEVVIPSSMTGDVMIFRTNELVSNVLNSISHGTGRTVSRADAKQLSASFDFEELRRAIYIPAFIANSSLRTEGPFCYRDIDACAELIKDLVTPVNRLKPIAYLGHL